MSVDNIRDTAPQGEIQRSEERQRGWELWIDPRSRMHGSTASARPSANAQKSGKAKTEPREKSEGTRGQWTTSRRAGGESPGQRRSSSSSSSSSGAFLALPLADTQEERRRSVQRQRSKKKKSFLKSCSSSTTLASFPSPPRFSLSLSSPPFGSGRRLHCPLCRY